MVLAAARAIRRCQDGQLIARLAPGLMQRSTRLGARPLRIVKVVSLPMNPVLATVTVSLTPGSSLRSRVLNRMSFPLPRLEDFFGQPFPLHLTVTSTPRGALTVSRLTSVKSSPYPNLSLMSAVSVASVPHGTTVKIGIHPRRGSPHQGA